MVGRRAAMSRLALALALASLSLASCASSPRLQVRFRAEWSDGVRRQMGAQEHRANVRRPAPPGQGWGLDPPARLLVSDNGTDSLSGRQAAERGGGAEGGEAEDAVYAELDLEGSVLETGYYAVDVELGTPPQTFQVIVDTGSTIAYVPCKSCGDKCGANHKNPPFDPAASKTSSFVPCFSDSCRVFCGKRRCKCQSSSSLLGILMPVVNVCMYEKYYQEKSSSQGMLVNDVVALGLGDVTSFTFGCETAETGEIFKQTADGIVGLGNSPSSMINQLAGSGAIDARAFSICIGGAGNGGGVLYLGDEPLPEGAEAHAVRAALVGEESNHPEFYKVDLVGISLGSDLVNVPRDLYSRGYGAVVDTGTTFIYLPEAAYAAFNQQLIATFRQSDKVLRVPGPDPRYPEDVCFAYFPQGLPQGEGAQVPSRPGEAAQRRQWKRELLSLFPNMTISMNDPSGKQVDLEVPPSNYLFQTRFATLVGFCVGVYNNRNAGTLLGGIAFRDVLVKFQPEKNWVEFAHANCTAL